MLKINASNWRMWRWCGSFFVLLPIVCLSTQQASCAAGEFFVWRRDEVAELMVHANLSENDLDPTQLEAKHFSRGGFGLWSACGSLCADD